MKKMILPTVCFLIVAGTASAQTRHSRRRGSTTSSTVTAEVPNQTETATTNTRVEKDNTGEVRHTSIGVIPDNRKEYMQDGQLATYTGHEATPVNAEQFQSPKKEKPIKKEEDQ